MTPAHKDKRWHKRTANMPIYRVSSCQRKRRPSDRRKTQPPEQNPAVIQPICIVLKCQAAGLDEGGIRVSRLNGGGNRQNSRGRRGGKTGSYLWMQSTGQTSTHFGLSKWPMHSTQVAASITKMSPPSVMDLVGHSGSHAPQAMQVSSMTSAITGVPQA
jgi:hypothetical protein